MEAFLLENLPILLCFLFGVVLLIVEVFLSSLRARSLCDQPRFLRSS